MNISVSITQFRQNIADYVAYAQAGDTVILKDQKKNEVIAELTGKKSFDLASFKKTLAEVAGTFTAQDHPQWRTKSNLVEWLEKGRKAADRSF